MAKLLTEYKKNINFNKLFGKTDFKVPRIIFVVGLLSVVLIASYANYSLNEKDRYRFKILTKAVIDTIYDRLDTHLILLRGIDGIYHETNNITYNALDSYVDSVDLLRYFPGARGIGFIPKIKSAEASTFTEKMKFEYFPAFSISPATSNDIIFPVAYFSPLGSNNQRIIGYDLYSEDRNRLAMKQAADSGLPSLSSNMELQNADAGFNIFYPVYARENDQIPDVKGLDKLEGFAYLSLLSRNFFSDIFRKGFEKYVNIEIYDNTSSSIENIYKETMEIDVCSECEVITDKINVLGNSWTLKFTSLPAFYSGSNKLIVFILCLGQLFLVFVISTLSYSQNKAKISAENANKDKEELLIRERIARSQAEQASRLKEEFLATVSHELRNPLNAILGWAQIINRPNTSQENILKGIKTIEKNVHVQAKLIDDLLEMSRITSGKLILEIKRIDFKKVLDNALETVDSALKAKNIIIYKKIPANLPEIMADETRLQQVIWNLLSNAIKFSPNGSSIELYTSVTDDSLQFRIKDQGKGISPEFLPHIFDRFRQENSKITKRHGGLGLGLAISKSLIELHGGKIEVKSDGSGKGAEFIFNIPIRPISEAVTSNRLTVNDNEIYGNKSLDKMFILVIDDEPDTLEMLAVLINEKGAKVECASSVDEALDMINQVNYDVVISDIGMPGKDGYELARSIRSHPSQNIRVKPLIALSAYARENDRNLSREAGFSAHLAKPLDVVELFQMIQNLA